MAADQAAESGAGGLAKAYARLEALASLPPLATAEGNGCPRLIAAVAALGAEAASRRIREGRLERARQAWREHVQGGRGLDPSNMMALCWAPEVAIHPDFCRQLSRSGPLRSRALRGLMSSYHETWSPSTDALARRLEEGLRSAGRVRGIVEKWISNVRDLVGPDAPSRFAAECVAARTSASARLAELRLSTTSPFAREAAQQLALSVSAQGRDAGLLAFAAEKIFPEDNVLLAPAAWGRAFHNLVDVYQGSVDDDRRQLLIDLALGTRGLPDPRLRQAEWQNVPEPTRKRIMQWLSKEDLRFFFDLLMEGQSDPQGRYPFWLDYAGCALRSKVVVGAIDQTRLHRELEEIESRGRTYASMCGAGGTNAHVSAFIMDFGDVTIVEFSQPNSACFIYQNNPTDRYLDLSRRSFDWHHLKNTRAGKYYAHSRTWQSKFRGILARHGIRPE